MRTQFGPQAFLKTIRRELPRWWSMLPESPAAAFDFLRKAANGELSMNWRSEELDKLRGELRQYNRRLVLAVTGASLFVAGAILFVAGAGSGGLVIAAGVLAAAGALLLVLNITGR